MGLSDPWDELLRSLKTWADARDVEEGIEVAFVAPGGLRRVVEVVMRPDDWEELSGVIAVETPETLKQRILALTDDHPFLVCVSGVELVASPSRVVASEADDSVPEPGGEWVATDAAGNVVSRFADWVEDEP